MASGHLVMLSLFFLSVPQKNLLFSCPSVSFTLPHPALPLPSIGCQVTKEWQKMTIAQSWQIFLQLLSDRDLEHLCEGPSAFPRASPRDGEK